MMRAQLSLLLPLSYNVLWTMSDCRTLHCTRDRVMSKYNGRVLCADGMMASGAGYGETGARGRDQHAMQLFANMGRALSMMAVRERLDRLHEDNAAIAAMLHVVAGRARGAEAAAGAHGGRTRVLHPLPQLGVQRREQARG